MPSQVRINVYIVVDLIKSQIIIWGEDLSHGFTNHISSLAVSRPFPAFYHI